MKRVLTIILLFCSLACCPLAMAQTRIPREVHLGVIGGANLSKYTFYPSATQKFSPSYTAGIAMRYIEETFFGLQAEFLLTQRVYADDFTEINPDFNYKRQLTYVELPVMAHVYFKLGDRNEVAFDAGPKFAFFLYDDISSNLPDDYGQVDTEYYPHTYLHHTLPISRKFDYGIQAGLGYEFKFNRKMSLQLQGRFYYGLANLWPDTKADIFQQSSNQSVQIVMSLWWHHVIRGKRVKL